MASVALVWPSSKSVLIHRPPSVMTPACTELVALSGANSHFQGVLLAFDWLSREILARRAYPFLRKIQHLSGVDGSQSYSSSARQITNSHHCSYHARERVR